MASGQGDDLKVALRPFGNAWPLFKIFIRYVTGKPLDMLLSIDCSANMEKYLLFPLSSDEQLPSDSHTSVAEEAWENTSSSSNIGTHILVSITFKFATF